MFAQFLKSLALPFFMLGIILLSVLNQPATAASPAHEKRAVMPQAAQETGVTLEKRASPEVVPLGQVVTYTVVIKNESPETINATLTDKLPAVPQGLALQTNSISATLGTFDKAQANDNVLVWSGSLAQGEEATILYHAIPPSTSTPGQTIDNVAFLEFGETTLEASAKITTQASELGIWGSFVNFIALALVFFDQALESVSVPYAFGFAIILFTLLVRAATFPLNMQQIKSSKAMQELQPKMKVLQEKYKNDREKLAQEQMALYKEAGVNPLGGCLPMLVQMPIWFALYQALLQLSTQGLLNQGFFWIPSLAGPVADYTGGIGWLWPLPPSIGWGPALAYLVLPVLLVVSQMYMQQLMTPPTSDPQQAQMQSIMKFMPLMFGYFALIVPSGLSLYWFTSNLLGMAQHYFTKTQADAAKPAPAGATISSPVPATSTANPILATPGEDEDEKDVKRKRKKSRRKR